ncbi:MAG: STAS domain-containing protein [Planctomycetota bacterium]
MPDSSTPVAVVDEKDVRIIEFTDSKILDEANIEEIGAKLFQLIGEKERPKLMLDFSNVDHLSSAALGKLIQANNEVRNRNGQLRLCGIKPQIFEVFAITKLDQIFKIYPTRSDAMASYN